MNPDGPSPIGDEALVPLAIITGAVFGVAVQRPGAEMAMSTGWGGIRVGPLREQLASHGERRRDMGPEAWEFRLSMLFRSSARWSAGPVLGVVSHGFEQVEREVRCGFGCFEADVLTSHTNTQALNAGFLARLDPGLAGGAFFASFGAGVGAISLESSMGEGEGLAPYVEGGAGLARAGGLFRALELGLRFQAADVGPARVDLSGAFLRLHLVHGG